MKQVVSPQQVIDRLMKRWGQARQSAASCRLGYGSRRRRGGACAACAHPHEFEIDQAITQLINSAVFQRAGICPYQVVASHLIAGLTLGPEVSRLRSGGQHRVDLVTDIKSILKCIRIFLHATGSTRDNIEAVAVSYDGSYWQALYAVLTAERALEKALALFQSEVSGKSSRSSRGRTGALDYQAIARATAGAWRELTGRLPTKDQFQVSWPARSRNRHYFRTSRQRAKLGIGDKDRSGAHQEEYSEQELIGGKFFSINTRLNEGESLLSPHQACGRCPLVR